MRSVVDQAEAPRVSVLLRTKDRPGFLAEALDSLRRQTFSDFETVLVNDGGPIPAALLEPAPGRSLRVVVPPAPGGRTRALNAGLAAARGTYVAYLDDDDLYLPEHLETLVRFLDGSDEYSAAYTSVRQLEQVLGDDGRYRDGRELTSTARPFDAARLLYKNDIPAHRPRAPPRARGERSAASTRPSISSRTGISSSASPRGRASITCPPSPAVYRLRSDASNITAAQPWHSGDAQAARRRLFEKHAARRSPSTEMALVDSLERRTRARSATRDLLAALEQVLADARAADRRGPRRPRRGRRPRDRASLRTGAPDRGVGDARAGARRRERPLRPTPPASTRPWTR